MNMLPRVITALVFFLAVSNFVWCTDIVPGAVLHLDASDNPDHENDAWTNLGTAGGRLLAADTAPTLEEGSVQIASLGILEEREYYTALGRSQTFGGPVEKNPQLFLGDWTLEILCKRNGIGFNREHQLVGFQNAPKERVQGVRFWVTSNGEIEWSVHSQGAKRNFSPTGVTLSEGEWSWITAVSINSQSVVFYQNGVEVRQFDAIEFDERLPIDEISIGAMSHAEKVKNFDGSFAIVRVYDKALTAEEVFRNVSGIPPMSLLFSASETIRVGSTFSISLVADDATDLAGWQLDIGFAPELLSAVSVNEGEFLTTNGAGTYFEEGMIDNDSGEITGIWGATAAGGVGGRGELLSVTFDANAIGKGELQLRKLKLGTSEGTRLLAVFSAFPFEVQGKYAAWDIDSNGVVDIADLILVAQNFAMPANPRADVNGDGEVDILDLILVAQHMGEGGNATPGGWYDSDARKSLVFSRRTVESLIVKAYAADDGSVAFRRGIANLERLLTLMTPRTTALLPNYPNPFNPETWIPYHLAQDAEVNIEIYDSLGILLRRLDLGHQTAGYYTNRTQAAYWDGRNATGESVASGTYYLRFSTPLYHQIRRMVILK